MSTSNVPAPSAKPSLPHWNTPLGEPRPPVEKSIINFGILGAGWWATTAHLPALQANPRARVIGLQSRSRDGLEKIASDYDVQHTFTSVEDLIALPGLDAVIDASTPNMHFHNARTCLRHGLHLLMEKPMSLTVAQASELVSLAEEKNLHLLISCPWHYTDHAIAAQRLVADGHLGDLKMISILFTNFSGGLYRAKTWKELFAEGGDPAYVTPHVTPEANSYSDPAIAGGGQIFCQVSHAAAYIGFLTGSDPAEVFAHFNNAEIDIDVYDTLCLKLRNGCLVTLASTGDPMPSRRQFELRAFGTEGMLLMELWEGTMEFHPRKGKVQIFPRLDEAAVYPLHAPANNLVDLVAGEAPNQSPGELGLYAMKIIESACISARTGRNVLLNPKPTTQSAAAAE